MKTLERCKLSCWWYRTNTWICKIHNHRDCSNRILLISMNSILVGESAGYRDMYTVALPYLDNARLSPFKTWFVLGHIIKSILSIGGGTIDISICSLCIGYQKIDKWKNWARARITAWAIPWIRKDAIIFHFCIVRVNF